MGAIAFCMAGLAACATKAPRATLAMPPPAEPPPQALHALTVAKRLSTMPPVAVPAVLRPPLDLSGRSETGRASYYARRFAGRRTADGQRFNPHAPMAASKTLPLGTVARVVNLTNGTSTTVTVADRGPNVESRMLDVSPEVAIRLGMIREGVARVLVEPISIPEPDGKVKLGAGAAHASKAQIAAAIGTSRRVMRQDGLRVADR